MRLSPALPPRRRAASLDLWPALRADLSVAAAGLIFLSRMTTAIVSHCAPRIESGELQRADVITTTLLTLAASTFLLGLALMAAGALRLTFMTHYLPTTVIGAPPSPKPGR
eukprot:SAG11_NODE_778_length_7212_cov_4.265392_6_plen_110_part_01